MRTGKMGQNRERESLGEMRDESHVRESVRGLTAPPGNKYIFSFTGRARTALPGRSIPGIGPTADEHNISLLSSLSSKYILQFDSAILASPDGNS